MIRAGTQLLLLLATLLVSGMAAPCWAASTRGEVFLEGGTITLGDIFADAGTRAGERVTDAPALGQKTVFDASALVQIAHAFGIAYTPSGNYERVTVIRLSNALTNAMIREAVTKEMEKTAPGADLDIALDNQALEIHRAKDEPLDYHLADFKHDPIKKRFEASLIVARRSTPDAEVVRITGRAMPMMQVALLNRPLQEGEAISEADLSWSRVAADKTGGDAITSPAALKNMEARRTLTAQSVLRVRDVRGQRLVTKGSLVTMVVETPVMQLATQGRALSDGAMGETIRILNTQSNRTVDGVVIGGGRISVVAPGSIGAIAQARD